MARSGPVLRALGELGGSPHELQHDRAERLQPHVVAGALEALLEDPFSPPAGLDPVAVLEEHLAVGWEYDVEVVIDAPLETVTRCLPRALGRLEPLDAGGTRLVGSTSNPAWYARQLAAIPASYRIVRCPELQDAARVLGQRLLAAGSAGP